MVLQYLYILLAMLSTVFGQTLTKHWLYLKVSDPGANHTGCVLFLDLTMSATSIHLYKYI